MANPNPNTDGLVRLDSQRAKEIASKPRVDSEPVIRRQFTLTKSQIDWLADNTTNASATIRKLLTEHIAQSVDKAR